MHVTKCSFKADDKIKVLCTAEISNRDAFKDNTFEAKTKAKASILQGQDQFREDPDSGSSCFANTLIQTDTKNIRCINTVGDFTFWIRPWLRPRTETKH